MRSTEIEMAEREYKDSEGNVVTLDKLVRIEPEWAANIIRWYEDKLDEYERREKLHMDRCQHDMERIVRLEQQLEMRETELADLEQEASRQRYFDEVEARSTDNAQAEIDASGLFEDFSKGPEGRPGP